MISVWDVNISLVVMTRVMTGHGKRRAGGAEEDDSVIRIKLAKLGAVSSILSKSQSSPVIKMKSIISLKFSWEIFWKLSVKENDKTNVIFMPSFTHNRWSLMLTGSITLPVLSSLPCDLTKHPPLSGGNQLRNIWEAQRQSKWYGKCYLYAIIYQQTQLQSVTGSLAGRLT